MTNARGRGHRLLLLASLSSLAAFAEPQPAKAVLNPLGYYGIEDFSSVRKFDAHVHVNASASAFLEVARADNFELLSINVDYPDFPSLALQEAVAVQAAALDPDRFHFATTFSMHGWEAEGWTTATNLQLDAAVKAGAIAVKTWKNIGMSVRTAKGALLMIDDPRLDPVFAHVLELRIPLIAHVGEPRNCWLPLEKMTTENDRSYFREHPEYHMYLHPELPSYEAQLAARDNRLTRTPGLVFVGAHLASLEWSVERIGAFLEANPLAVVDMAARMTQVQYQSHESRRKVRDFFIRYQDRILYGSDLTLDPAADPATFRQEAHDFWLSDWTYLATGKKRRINDLAAFVVGLKLPRTVIDKIYWANARRTFFPQRGVGIN